jgi:hypothetical protein
MFKLGHATFMQTQRSMFGTTLFLPERVHILVLF